MKQRQNVPTFTEESTVLDRTGSLLRDVLDRTGSLLRDVLDRTGSLLRDVLDRTGSLLRDVLDRTGSLLRDVLDRTGSLWSLGQTFLCIPRLPAASVKRVYCPCAHIQHVGTTANGMGQVRCDRLSASDTLSESRTMPSTENVRATPSACLPSKLIGVCLDMCFPCHVKPLHSWPHPLTLLAGEGDHEQHC